jgi:carboxyl-terminal processing protease
VQTIIPLGSGNGALRLTTEELKARTDTSGEASLRGHLKAQGDEQTGSQSYIPPDPKDDKALPCP